MSDFDDAINALDGLGSASGSASLAANAHSVRHNSLQDAILALRSAFMMTIYHGSEADAVRPSDALVVYWIGTAEPENAVAPDLWYEGDI